VDHFRELSDCREAIVAEWKYAGGSFQGAVRLQGRLYIRVLIFLRNVSLLCFRGSHISHIALQGRQFKRFGGKVFIRNKSKQMTYRIEPCPSLIIAFHHKPGTLPGIGV
jgi:hypothetical protein